MDSCHKFVKEMGDGAQCMPPGHEGMGFCREQDFSRIYIAEPKLRGHLI
jgi:hypothetical protein